MFRLNEHVTNLIKLLPVGKLVSNRKLRRRPCTRLLIWQGGRCRAAHFNLGQPANCFVEKMALLQTELRAIPKSHYEFLLPPKEGEGQDEGASFSLRLKPGYF